MDFWSGLWLITGIHLLAAASPGPDFVLVSQQTLARGKAAGLWCSLGITLGLAVHIVYSVLGLAAVMAHSHKLLWLIKLFGGAYLIYLGFSGLRARPRAAVTLTSAELPTRSIWRQLGSGFLCNVLNPKAPVYFVSLFTLVLSPQLPLWQLALYGGWMMCLQLFWFSLVVLLLSVPTVNRRFQRLGHYVDRVLGAAMLLLGIKLISSRL